MDEIIKTIVLPGSLSAVLLAVALWLGSDWISKRLATSVAHEYDKKLEGFKAGLDAALEYHRATVQQSLHVAKSQFDMEFASFKELWAEVSKVLELTARLINAHLKSAVTGNTNPLRELATEADAAFFAAHKKATDVAPFMPADVHAIAKTLNERCKEEIDRYFYMTKPARTNVAEFDTKEFHAQQKLAKAALLQDYRALETAIRGRLASLSGTLDRGPAFPSATPDTSEAASP
jgi:hypothetical protein